MAGTMLSILDGAVPSGAELVATSYSAPMWHPAGHLRLAVVVERS